MLVGTLSFCASLAWAGTATFDFDNCTPVLTAGMSTPLDQACGAMDAHILSSHDGLQGGGYSVQNYDTTYWTLHLFTGNYLVPNGLDPGTLGMNFNTSLTAITFNFATADFNQNETPTTILMTAYNGSKKVGAKKAHGTYGSDTMPMGTLKFKAAKGKVFNRIVISIPPAPLASSDVLVDNIAVTY